MFINKDIHNSYLPNKYFFTTENSLNYQEKDNIKDNNKQELNTVKKTINSKNSININESNFPKDNNIKMNSNKINNKKKSSVLKIKGIQIKNFNKIYNKEKSESNSSKKSIGISYKINKPLLKIPKNKTNNIILDIIKKKENEKSKRLYNLKKQIKINLNDNVFLKSLTERDKSTKSKNGFLS